MGSATTATSTGRRRLRHLAIGVGSVLTLAACGGSDGSAGSSENDLIADESSTGQVELDTSDLDTSGLDTSGLDTSGLDEGQQEILEDVLEDGFDDGGPSPVVGIQLVTTSGVDTITDAFPEELDFPAVEVIGFPENHQQGKSSVVAGDGAWVAADDTLHRFLLADGTESASVAVSDVLPGDDQAEFVGIDGDETGVFALINGFDATMIVEIDPVSGAVVATHDVNAPGLRGVQLAAGPTHVAVAYNGSTPVRVLDRANGTTAEIGNPDRSQGVAVTSDRLALSNAPGNVNDPFTYDVHSLTDGSLLTSGELPYGEETLRVHGDRILQHDDSIDQQPLFEVDPQGRPAAEFLPADIVQVSDWVEADGVIYLITRCCVIDEFGNGLSTVAIDASTGQLLGGAQDGGTHIVLP